MAITVLDGNLQMILAYYRHRNEQDKFVQILGDMEVEADFLAAIRKERIK